MSLPLAPFARRCGASVEEVGSSLCQTEIATLSSAPGNCGFAPSLRDLADLTDLVVVPASTPPSCEEPRRVL